MLITSPADYLQVIQSWNEFTKILDIRTLEEYVNGHFKGSTCLPLDVFADRGRKAVC